MKIRLLCGLVAVGLLAAAPAHAGIRYYRPAQVQFKLPSGWSYSQGSTGVLTVSPRDKTLAIVFSMMPLTNIDKALKHARKSLKQNIKHVRIKPAKRARMGGMPGYFLRGKGKLANGAKVEFGLVVLISPTRKALMVMALGAIGKYEKHARNMMRCLASIAPKGGGGQGAATSFPSATKRLFAALKHRKRLSPLMSKRVRLTYETSDRSEGTFRGRGTFSAKALDGTVRIRGKHNGKRKKTVKFNLRKKARAILEETDSLKARNKPATTVNLKKMTYELTAVAPSATFFFRWEGKGARRRLAIYKVAYAVHDPG